MSARVVSAPSEFAGNQVALLHRISSLVSSGVELEAMLGELVDLILTVTDADACLVYLLDPQSGEMVLRASNLPHAEEIGRLRLKIGEGITGWVSAAPVGGRVGQERCCRCTIQIVRRAAGRYV